MSKKRDPLGERISTGRKFKAEIIQKQARRACISKRRAGLDEPHFDDYAGPTEDDYWYVPPVSDASVANSDEGEDLSDDEGNDCSTNNSENDDDLSTDDVEARDKLFNQMEMNELLKSFEQINFHDGYLSSKADDRNNKFNPFPQSTNQSTKTDFCNEYSQFAAMNSIKPAVSERLFQMLQKFLPEVSWPLAKSARGKKKNTLNLNAYVPEDGRRYKMDVCVKGCHAYVGIYAKEIRCPNTKCNKPRYRDCTQNKCKNPNCNPFDGTGCSVRRRIPIRTAYYLPIIPLFKELVHWSITTEKDVYKDNFMAASQKTYITKINSKGENEQLVGDVTDSKQATYHKNKMANLYKQECAKFPNLDLEEWSFITSEFYDGGTLFARRSKSVWPLVLTILNCNPDARIKIGIGMFLVALHDLAVGCRAEQSIFSELLMPELNFLGRGHIFSFVHKGKTRNIFLQVRLILHTYDTMALLKMLKLPGM